MGRRKYSCPCSHCDGTERILKTIKLHMAAAGTKIPEDVPFSEWFASYRRAHGLVPVAPAFPFVGVNAGGSPNIDTRLTETDVVMGEPDRGTEGFPSPGNNSSQDVFMGPLDGAGPHMGASGDNEVHAHSPVPSFPPPPGSSPQPDTPTPTLPSPPGLLFGTGIHIPTPSPLPAPLSQPGTPTSDISVNLENLENNLNDSRDDSFDDDDELDVEAWEQLRQDARERAAMRALQEEDEDNQPFSPIFREEREIPSSHIESINITNSFIRRLREATLDNAKLDAATIARLKDPPAAPLPALTDDMRMNLKMWMASLSASQDVYHQMQDAVNERYPDAKVPSFTAMEQTVRELTGITSITDDICVNSCHAFTGDFANHDHCSHCGAERYLELDNGKRVALKTMTTIPLGPQLIALKQSRAGCEALRYRDKKTQEIFEQLQEDNEGAVHVYDDVFCGSEYLQLADELELTEDDIVVGFSLDGAQLYQKKKSDTWIGIWVIFDYDPILRYKRKHILPAFVVPGPNKPKLIDSFTFRSFHHLSALQRHDEGQGVKMWDAAKQCVTRSRIIFFVGMADAVALPELDGRVGHQGALGCRLGCKMRGRHKPGVSCYYPVHLKPHEYRAKGCDHDDVDVRNLSFPTIDQYLDNLHILSSSRNQTQYEDNRLATGLCKPSIISGLHPRYTVPVPKCFSVDLMHLLYINIADALIPLWQGKYECAKTDSVDTWNWVCLKDPTIWKAHGKLVEDSTRYFPSSYHRPPRNPAEKINSGYKATEYYSYLFGLGIAFFRVHLPFSYWQNFCKLARAIHIIVQRSLSPEQIQEAHLYFVQFVGEFELLYYQRRIDRMHFCRPWIHTILHLPSEVLRVGPGSLTTQFMMERSIGDYGREIRQPSNPYGNLARIMERQSQVNTLKVMWTELNHISEKPVPKKSLDVGQGFRFLHPSTKGPIKLVGPIREAMERDAGISYVTVWERLKLPNGQVIRSLRKEKRATKMSRRVTRNAKIFRNGAIQYGEIQFYFRCQVGSEWVPKALVSLYSPPQPRLLAESFNTLSACKYTGEDGLAVINVDEIQSLVAMVPLPIFPEEDYHGYFFVIEKSGLEDAEIVAQ